MKQSLRAGKASRERAILEAAEAFGPGALDLLRDAARADAYWDAIPRGKNLDPKNLDPKKVEREILDAIKNAPPDVDRLLLSFVRCAAEIIRKGGQPAVSRAALRDVLVPKGKQGRRQSRMPFDVFVLTARTPEDMALLDQLGFRVKPPADSAKRDEQVRRLFDLTPSALRMAKLEGRKAARGFLGAGKK